ncbi:MAG TPA: diacylglycerol kinase family protein [Candidatus Polarisedimenticolaceae bacterium]|nr:diacylglycerol kinase family protein [Candidatus Polarisedimenticolaceae bacterium]
MASDFTVIVNAGARKADDTAVYRQLAEIFTAKGLRADIQLARSGGEIVELARRAINGESSVVVAGGGDGTINAVASELVGSNKILGVLPLGTLNHLAKDLGMPLDLESAVDVIAQQSLAQMDIGEVNGRYFLNNSGLGLYPGIVHERQQQQAQGRSKWLAFFSAVLIIIHRYPLLTVRLSAEGRELRRRTPMVFVGNNEYELQGLNMGSRKFLNHGKLFLYVTREMSRWRLLKIGLAALFGRLSDSGDFDAMSVGEASVQARRRHLRVALDGEVVVMRLPLRYRIHPAALRVIVPADKEESGR